MRLNRGCLAFGRDCDDEIETKRTTASNRPGNREIKDRQIGRTLIYRTTGKKGDWIKDAVNVSVIARRPIADTGEWFP